MQWVCGELAWIFLQACLRIDTAAMVTASICREKKCQLCIPLLLYFKVHIVVFNNIYPVYLVSFSRIVKGNMKCSHTFRQRFIWLAKLRHFCIWKHACGYDSLWIYLEERLLHEIYQIHSAKVNSLYEKFCKSAIWLFIIIRFSQRPSYFALWDG